MGRDGEKGKWEKDGKADGDLMNLMGRDGDRCKRGEVWDGWWKRSEQGRSIYWGGMGIDVKGEKYGMDGEREVNRGEGMKMITEEDFKELNKEIEHLPQSQIF